LGHDQLEKERETSIIIIIIAIIITFPTNPEDEA